MSRGANNNNVASVKKSILKKTPECVFPTSLVLLLFLIFILFSVYQNIIFHWSSLFVKKKPRALCRYKKMCCMSLIV